MDEHRAGRAAVNPELDESIRPGVTAEVVERASIEGDVLGRESPAEDDGGQPAGSPELVHSFAGRRPALGGEAGTVGGGVCPGMVPTHQRAMLVCWRVSIPRGRA